MTATLECPAPPEVKKPRSGGPRTQEGKDASRRNALKHGMRSEVVFPEDLAEVIAERTGQFNAQFQPVGPYEEWLIGQVAINTALIDRCAEVSIAELQRLASRASLCWDQDRQLAVTALVSKLSKDPSRTVANLRTTKHGVAWLIERWDDLGEALRRSGLWDDAQRTLAFDLLGIPHTLRSCSRILPMDADRNTLTTLVDQQLTTLRHELSEALEALDEGDRELAELGIPIKEDAQTQRQQRYEGRYQRSLHWALAEFRRVHGSNATAAPVETWEQEPTLESLPPESPFFRSKINELLASLAVSLDPTEESEDEPCPVPEPSAAPSLNRRARKAQEKQARLNAKRAACVR
ncbi:MAG: hypothetical protein ABI353_00350 [Isosphaeraceae bacterium]